MSGLVFKQRQDVPQRLDLSALIPRKLAGLSPAEIEKIDIAASGDPTRVGDVFTVSGSISAAQVDGENSTARLITFEADLPRGDNIATGLRGGQVHVTGSVGRYAGARIFSGSLRIDGDAGEHLGSELKGGRIIVAGRAGDHLGAPPPGVRDGQAGGIIVVKKGAGDYCGERMRRGLVAVSGTIGAYAGARMLGGTIYTTESFGANPAFLMRRGTLITPKLSHPPATFVDCGSHDLNILTIMARHYQKTGEGEIPPFPTGPARRYAGCSASVGRGEILVTGA